MKKVTMVFLIMAIFALQGCFSSSSDSTSYLEYLDGENRSEWEELATPISAGEYEISNPYLEFMPDGRMVIVEGNDDTEIEVAVETSSSAEDNREFSYITTIPGSGGWNCASFVEVVDDDEILVGTADRIYLVSLETGDYEVLAETTNYDAVLSGSTLYFTWAEMVEYDGHVSSLDIDDEPIVITDLISGIPGASAGIALDDSGKLYTGNGYANSGYETGEIRSFDMYDVPLAWDDGSIIGDVLTSGSLLWAGQGTLLVGGGEVFVDDGDNNYFTVLDTLTGEKIWMLDPDGSSDASTYRLSGNRDELTFAASVWDYILNQGTIYLAH